MQSFLWRWGVDAEPYGNEVEAIYRADDARSVTPLKSIESIRAAEPTLALPARTNDRAKQRGYAVIA